MKYFYLFILLFIVGCSKNPKNKSTSDKFVKHQLGISHSYNFGKLQTTLADTTHTYYDSLGNEIEQYKREFTGRYKFYEKRNYKYGPNGRIKELIIFDTNGSIIAKYINYYDEKNLLIGEDKYAKENENSNEYSFEHIIYKYRDTLKIEEYNNTTKDKQTFIYNERNQLIKTNTYYNGELGWIEEYKYDDSGNKIFSRSIHASGKYENIRKYKYDSKNRYIEEISLGKDNRQAFRSALKYDNNNRLIEYKEFNELDEPNHITKYYYSFW